MAWRSSGSSNATLVENLARNGLIKSDRVKAAMLKVLSLAALLPSPSRPEDSHANTDIRRSIARIMLHPTHTKTLLSLSAIAPPSQRHTCMPQPVNRSLHI